MNDKQTVKQLERYFDLLWPICRSITGNGLRKSFAILQKILPLKLTEVPTGKKVFDWEIPMEWNINDAYLITPGGKRIAEFKKNNLHVVGYSIPVNRKLKWSQLEPHLFYMRNLPDAVPYVTSYYKRNWGFCISYNEFQKLSKKGMYHAVIDSSLQPGSLTYGETVLKGSSKEEVLFSSYLCHPSMANNELSGPLALAFLYKKISSLKHKKFTYRFVIAPETIGTIAYLFANGKHLKQNLMAGYVMTCCGDKGNFTYKRSRQGTSLADRVAEHVLKHSGKQYRIIPFEPSGSDERQYCSPGFNLPVGSLMRTKYHDYPEYHTSLDNKKFISFKALMETVNTYYNIVRSLELNGFYKNKVMFCEPNLGKRGLYADTSGKQQMPDVLVRRNRVLNFMDGSMDLLSLADRYNYSILDLEKEIKLLLKKELLSEK